jgi:hypothetical protein
MRTFRLSSCLSALAVLAVNGAAWAQQNYTAPTPNPPATPKYWLGIIIAVVLAIAIVGISLAPSKRTHQD